MGTREVHCKELAPALTEAEQPDDPQLASWRPGRAACVLTESEHEASPSEWILSS